MAGPETGSIAWLKAKGFRPRRSLGQNFLFDGNLLRAIVREAGFNGTEQALEIGAGIGNLTAELARVARCVTAIEIDRRLIGLAKERLEGLGDIRLLEGDVLAGKHALSSALTAAVADGGRPLKLVANLPYSVAAPVIALAVRDLAPCRLVVTVQKEVADRLAAGPGEPSYGGLSVWVRAFGEPALVRTIRAEAFWPRPKVQSAVIRIDAAEHRLGAREWAALDRVIGIAFRHPRKQVRRALVAAFGEVAEQELAGLRADARAGDIPPSAYIAISKLLNINDIKNSSSIGRIEGLR